MSQNVTRPGEPGGPGRGWYVFASAILLVGIVVLASGLWYGITQIISFGSSLQRVVVPGGGTISLAEPGTYTIYYEHQSTLNGQSFNTPVSMPGMTCTVMDLANNQPLAISSSGMNVNYSLGSRAGFAVWRFDASHQGDYYIDATYAGGSGVPIVLAVGRPGVVQMVLGIFAIMGGVGAFVLMFAGALVIFLIAFLKRRSARKRMVDAAHA